MLGNDGGKEGGRGGPFARSWVTIASVPLVRPQPEDFHPPIPVEVGSVNLRKIASHQSSRAAGEPTLSSGTSRRPVPDIVPTTKGAVIHGDICKSGQVPQVVVFVSDRTDEERDVTNE